MTHPTAIPKKTQTTVGFIHQLNQSITDEAYDHTDRLLDEYFDYARNPDSVLWADITNRLEDNRFKPVCFFPLGIQHKSTVFIHKRGTHRTLHFFRQQFHNIQPQSGTSAVSGIIRCVKALKNAFPYPERCQASPRWQPTGLFFQRFPRG